MTWQYDGQQSFPCVNVPLEAHDAEGDEEAEDPSEGADSLLGAIRIDRLGRRWKVTSLDWVAFNYDVADYWADVDATIGLDLDPIGTPEFQDMDDEENSDWTIIPFSNSSSYTTSTTCPGGNSVLVWGGTDERSNESLTSLNAKYSGFVSVDVGSTNDICGGALISDRVAVTAAHCVRGESDVKVKTISGATIGVEIILNPKYAGSLGSNPVTGKEFPKKSSLQHDWAILILESSVSDTPMMFSKDGVVAVKHRRLERIGMGGFDYDFANNSCGSTSGGKVRVHPAEPVRGTRRGTVRARWDSSSGDSGGPMFRFRSGQTTARLYGVLSGAMVKNVTPWDAGVAGARKSQFKGFALGVVKDQ